MIDATSTEKIDWIDLPSEDYRLILGYTSEQVNALNELIIKYHQIEKTSALHLGARVNALYLITEHLHLWIQNDLKKFDKRKHLQWINGIASAKRNYIQALKELYAEGRHEEVNQHEYHHCVEGLLDPALETVFLTADHYFSLKTKEYWGDFWYENLDPCHRRLTPFLNQWRAARALDPHLPHAFLWLEGQHLPGYVPRVWYPAPAELERFRVKIQGGRFWQRSGQEWVPAHADDRAKRCLFAINLKGELYAGDEAIGLSHSSFTHGRPVLGAGLLRFDEGQLLSVALESGHFMPTIDIGFQILKLFERNGAVFPSQLGIEYFHERNKYSVLADSNALGTKEGYRQLLESGYSDQGRSLPCSK